MSKKFTVKDFHRELERLYWGYTWNWWKRIKFEIRWLLGHYKDAGGEP